MIIENPTRVLILAATQGMGAGVESPFTANAIDADLGYKTGFYDLMHGFFSLPILQVL